MADNVHSAVGSARPRDLGGLFKWLLEAHPRDALRLLCGARLDGAGVIHDEPPEPLEQHDRQCSGAFLVLRGDGVPTDVYHIVVQVERTEGFQEWMVTCWSSLALKYSRSGHRIHQVVLWPLGNGYPGRFRRDRSRLEYRSVSVPDDPDPGMLLASPLAPLALWSQKPPPDLVERVVDQIAATTVLEEQLVQVELCMLAGGDLAAEVLDALGRKGLNDVVEQARSDREIEQGRL